MKVSPKTLSPTPPLALGTHHDPQDRAGPAPPTRRVRCTNAGNSSRTGSSNLYSFDLKSALCRKDIMLGVNILGADGRYLPRHSYPSCYRLRRSQADGCMCSWNSQRQTTTVERLKKVDPNGPWELVIWRSALVGSPCDMSGIETWGKLNYLKFLTGEPHKYGELEARRILPCRLHPSPKERMT